MDKMPPLQPHLIHAAAYSSLFLQMLGHLFPEQKVSALSEDERRIVQNETDILLMRSRWRLESVVFANTFGIPQQPRENVAPADTVLGAPLAARGGDSKLPGQYA
jgi:hypothetical protein